jgi:hypothetical protein
MLPPNTGSIFRLLDDGGKKTSVTAAVAFGLGYWIGKNEKYRDYDRQHHERHDEHNRHQYDKHADRESHRNYKHEDGYGR